YFRDQIHAHGISDVVRQEPPMPYKDALAAMSRSFALLLSIDRDPYTSCYPSKYFEYLYVRRPIFVLGQKRGAGARAMEQGIAVQAAEEDAPAIREALLTLYQRFLKQEIGIPQVPVEAFERRYQAEELDTLLTGKEASSAIATHHG